MLATLARELPRGPEWTYEVKWDGYRTFARKEGTRVTLLSRSLKNATALYPGVARAVARLRPSTALLDGELVAIDEHGYPSFQALHHQRAPRIVYYAFDLLHLEGRDLMRAPLDERRDTLTATIAGSDVLQSEPLPGTAAEIESTLREMRLEGAVAKRRRSIYEPGRRSRAWVKVKFNRRQELVVGGFKPNDTNFESLLVGYYADGELHFAGKVRAGLTPRMRTEIFQRLQGDRMRRCPFVDLPRSGSSHWGEGISESDMAGLRWVQPSIVVEVSFVEWARDGLLRHPEFVGVRDDKAPRDVGREES
jgi:bifunctional non-homologous end joining protein LigD